MSPLLFVCPPFISIHFRTPPKGDALIPVPLTPVAALAEKEDAAIKKIRHDIATNREHCAHKSGPYAHISENP